MAVAGTGCGLVGCDGDVYGAGPVDAAGVPPWPVVIDVSFDERGTVAAGMARRG